MVNTIQVSEGVFTVTFSKDEMLKIGSKSAELECCEAIVVDEIITCGMDEVFE